MRRWTALFALTLGLSATLVPVPTTAAQPTLTWGNCPGTAPTGAECATLRVPLDHRDPRGRTIEIAVSRSKATAPQRRGVLVANPGGPGTPGRYFPATLTKLLIDKSGPEMRAALAQYDLIGFDPRGVGASNPVSCGLTSSQLRATSAMFPRPGGFDEDTAAARSVAKTCVSALGDLAPHLNTENTARDMDFLRRALGERTISYYGNSYGSYLGVVYAELFGEHTDRVVLDSVADAQHGWREQYRLLPEMAELRFTDFAEWAVSHGFSGSAAEMRHRYLALANRVDQSPLQVGQADPVTVDGSTLRSTVFSLLATDVNFPKIAAVVRHLEQPSPATEPEAHQVLKSVRDASLTNEAGRSLALAVVCGDSRWPTEPWRYARDLRVDAARYPITDGAFGNIAPCAFWPYQRDPISATSNGPSNVLVVNGTRDLRTPLTGARSTRQALGSRARLVTVEHVGHGMFGAGNRCLNSILARWLGEGQRPATDTHCPA